MLEDFADDFDEADLLESLGSASGIGDDLTGGLRKGGHTTESKGKTKPKAAPTCAGASAGGRSRKPSGTKGQTLVSQVEV